MNRQPTSQPSSLFIAPSLPEDISSDITLGGSKSFAPTLNNIGQGDKETNPTLPVVVKQQNALEVELNYVWLIIIAAIAFSFSLFMYRR